MAAYSSSTVLRHVFQNFKLNSCTIKSFNAITRTSFFSPVRFLYSEEYLAVDKYIERRKRVLGQFGGLKEKFCSRMLESLERKDQITVFTEDLKNMVYMVEDNENEMDICIRMIHQFNQQNKELRFGTFIFGPVVMRMLYYLDKPDVAFQLLTDEKLEGFFYQVGSFHIAMDLLFRHKRYQEILSLYELFTSKNLPGSKFPGSCVILVTAACYMLNTEESFEYSKQLATKAREAGATFPRRAVTFISHLALKRKDPKTAMEILSVAPQFSYITIRNLRMISLAEMDRLEDIFSTLRTIINSDVPTHARTVKEICFETVEHIQQAVDRVNDKDHARIFEQIKRGLKENNHLTEKTIEDMLLTPIVLKPSFEKNPGMSITGGSYSVPRRGLDSPKSSRLFQTRPGLRDMEE